MKFLVDECLSPDLVKLAHDRVTGSRRTSSGDGCRESRTGS